MHIPGVKSHCKENLEMPLLVERLECTWKDIRKNLNGQGPSKFFFGSKGAHHHLTINNTSFTTSLANAIESYAALTILF